MPTAKTTLNPAHVRPERRALHNEPRLDDTIIGPEAAATLWSEGLFRTFSNRKQVAAYAGLAPTPWQSGSVHRDQGVSKAGNPWLRTAIRWLANGWRFRSVLSVPTASWMARSTVDLLQESDEVRASFGWPEGAVLKV